VRSRLNAKQDVRHLRAQSNPMNSKQSDSLTGTLASHRILSFDGTDAASFLQGYLTCDTDKLETQTALPGAFTNLKGRVVANGWVWGEATAVRMLLATSLTETVAEFLKPYMNFSKTKLSVANTAPVVTLLGPVTKDTQETQDLIQIGTDRGLSKALGEMPDSQLTDISSEWLERCIAADEVVVTKASSETYLPQMLGLTKIGAVSFDKGCYLGQEIVARAEHRGEVKRRLRRATHSAQTKLASGSKVTDKHGKVRANLICASKSAALLVSSDDLTGEQHWFIDDRPLVLTLLEEVS